MKHWAVLLGFAGLAQGFQAPRCSVAGLQSPRTLHRVHADDVARVRQAKWLESLNNKSGVEGLDAGDDDAAASATIIVANNPDSKPALDALARSRAKTEFGVEQAGLGAAALAAALTVALDVGFLGGAAKVFSLALEACFSVA